jgi:hypothetical protein
MLKRNAMLVTQDLAWRAWAWLWQCVCAWSDEERGGECRANADVRQAAQLAQ